MGHRRHSERSPSRPPAMAHQELIGEAEPEGQPRKHRGRSRDDERKIMIDERLKRVILKELDLDDYPLEDDTLANGVSGWDSLSHVRVLAAVETEFGIRLRALEVLRLKNVGDLRRLVEQKQAKP